MANNVTLPPSGTGDVNPKASTDQVSADSSQVQNVQLAAVAGGVLTRNPVIPVSATSLPLPTGASTEATLAALNVLEGAVNETAPATDTANSGLNGRLQRTAQRLTSLIALLPTSLGQKTMANGLAVTIASDQSTVNVAQTGSLPVGANAIGKLAANSGVDIGDVDVTSSALPTGAATSANQLVPVQATTATLANVSGSASSVTLQASNASRKGLVIINDSTAILYVKFGSSASTTSFTYFLAGSVSGVPATLELPTVIYTGIVTGIWASATGAARMTELT